MNMVDAQKHTTSSVVVSDWLTDPIDVKSFEMSEDWNCDDTRYPDFGATSEQKKLADWDLLSFFFPEEVEPDSPPLTIDGTLTDSSAASIPRPRRVLEAEAYTDSIPV